MQREGRLLHENWDLYDTRHVVFQPRQLTRQQLEAGYWQAYRDFYAWGSIFKGAWTKKSWQGRLRHLAYAGGWKKFEKTWDWVIRMKRVGHLLPVLEGLLRAGRGAED